MNGSQLADNLQIVVGFTYLLIKVRLFEVQVSVVCIYTYCVAVGRPTLKCEVDLKRPPICLSKTQWRASFEFDTYSILKEYKM